MAYVRQRGNQLVIVHGERDPETKKVNQRVLFTIYSKAEALEALGRSGARGPRFFEALLEGQYPEIEFDWGKVREAIEKQLDILPDLFEYRETRLRSRFHQAMCDFTRQLALADPQWLISSAQLIQSERYALDYIGRLIDWRLKLCDQKEGEFNVDNPFYWRFELQGRQVPSEAEEMATGYYERGELERAEAAFRLLIDCFDGYADGYNYLGLIALDRGELDQATTHFERTIELGRRMFPRRTAKKHYWKDLSTRPYMRGLRNLALTLNEAGRFEEALAICDRLENECGDDISAAAHRASAFLNTGRWEDAARAAEHIHLLHPTEDFVVALARFELGQKREAIDAFLHAALNSPRAAHILVGLRTARPTNSWEAEDHNSGVHWLRALRAYLSERQLASKRFFRRVIGTPHARVLLDEIADVTRRWREQRTSDDREPFDRMNLMRSREFARVEAGRIAKELGLEPSPVTEPRRASRRRSSRGR